MELMTVSNLNFRRHNSGSWRTSSIDMRIYDYCASWLLCTCCKNCGIQLTQADKRFFRRVGLRFEVLCWRVRKGCSTYFIGSLWDCSAKQRDFGEGNRLQERFQLWLLWIQNFGKIVPFEIERISCWETSEYVDESFNWNSCYWYSCCYQYLQLDEW